MHTCASNGSQKCFAKHPLCSLVPQNAEVPEALLWGEGHVARTLVWQGRWRGRDAGMAGTLVWQGRWCGRDAGVAGMLAWQGRWCGRDAGVAGTLARQGC